VKVLSPLLLAATMMFLAPVFPAFPTGKTGHRPNFQPQHETVIFKTQRAPKIELGRLDALSGNLG
jgi:hypothetical protein